MVKPINLTLRQMLEGMTLTFDASAAGDMDATLQFNVTGAEPGTLLSVHHRGRLYVPRGRC